MNKLFVIIVSFNGGKDLIELVRSLKGERKRIKNTQIEIVIVDNGSTEGMIDKRKAQSTKCKIKIIENDKNLGFAGGCNVGIKYALKNKADSVLLLNQDVMITKNFISSLLKNPADIVSPVIKFIRSNKWVFDFGGKINWWLGRTKHLECHNEAMLQCYNEKNIDYVSGCAMLVKGYVFEKIGLFDERYFIYFEDVDFCLRAKKAGYRIAIEPKSMITHKLSEGAEKPFPQKLNLLRSNFIFINRYLGWKKPIGYFYLLILGGRMIFDSL